MSNYNNNMSGNKYDNGFTPMMDGQGQLRYVPPQKRPLTFGAMPPIERPESAMSNDSFVSQAIGGVSLNTLLGHGDGQGAEMRVSSNVGGTFGGPRGYAGDFGRGAMMGGGGQGFQQTGYGQLGGNGGFGSGQGVSGGYGGVGASSQGNYAYGNMSMPNSQVSHCHLAINRTANTMHPQAPSFFKHSNMGVLPTFGAIGTAISRYPPASKFNTTAHANVWQAEPQRVSRHAQHRTIS